MTTMVASHQGDFWQQRNQHTFHMPNMHLPGLMSPFEPQRSVNDAAPPPPRTFHQTASTVEMSLPLFSTNGLTSSVPYQSGAFAFDPIPVNPYNMQQTYPMGYMADVPQNVSYARSSLIQQLPAHQEGRPTFPTDSKSVSASPLQSSTSYHGSSYGTELERSRSEPTESTGINFATDVDTLMKAIQAKQPESPQVPQVNKVSQPLELRVHPLTQDQEDGEKPSQKPRKRYQCNMPGCNKSFYQKTHLEIHVRAHTGAKPFVSCSIHHLYDTNSSETGLQSAILWPAFFTTWQSQGTCGWLFFVQCLTCTDTRETTHGRASLQLRYMRQDIRTARQCARPQDRPSANQALHLQT